MYVCMALYEGKAEKETDTKSDMGRLLTSQSLQLEQLVQSCRAKQSQRQVPHECRPLSRSRAGNVA